MGGQRASPGRFSGGASIWKEVGKKRTGRIELVHFQLPPPRPSIRPNFDALTPASPDPLLKLEVGKILKSLSSEKAFKIILSNSQNCVCRGERGDKMPHVLLAVRCLTHVILSPGLWPCGKAAWEESTAHFARFEDSCPNETVFCCQTCLGIHFRLRLNFLTELALPELCCLLQFGYPPTPSFLLPLLSHSLNQSTFKVQTYLTLRLQGRRC